jgi:KUP system potassium uptake protein
MIEHVRNMGALHRNLIALSVLFEDRPRIPDNERVIVERIADGLWRVIVRFGFVEVPDLPAALREIKGLDPSVDLDKAVYFAARDLVVARPKSDLLENLRLPIFAFLYRNAVKYVDLFNLPSQNVVEIAREIEV